MIIDTVLHGETEEEITYPIVNEQYKEYHFHYKTVEGWYYLKSSWATDVVSNSTRQLLNQLGLDWRVVNAKTGEVITHSNHLIQDKLLTLKTQ